MFMIWRSRRLRLRCPSLRMVVMLQKKQPVAKIAPPAHSVKREFARDTLPRSPPQGCLTVLGDTARRSVSRGANPGTDSQFPANCAGNLVSVPGLRRIATHLPQNG